ncbi:MAG: hypothetical protein ACK5MR_18705 [Cumulibacter sp.]
MPRRQLRCATQQLDLFRPKPKRPRWSELPLDTRRKTLPLIAALLRSTLLTSKEGGDER